MGFLIYFSSDTPPNLGRVYYHLTRFSLIVYVCSYFGYDFIERLVGTLRYRVRGVITILAKLITHINTRLFMIDYMSYFLLIY